MASNTENLNLLMKNPSTDGADTFNVQTMLNDNWQKIDNNAGTVAQTLANILKPTTPPIIGLPPSTTPDGMFQALGNTGELHVWRKTVKNAADVSAGYNLGVKTTKTIVNTKDNSSGSSAIYYSSSVSVSDSGKVSLKNPTSIGVDIYTSSLPIVGKFFYIDLSVVQTSDLIQKKIYFVPSDTDISVDDSPKAFSGVVQEVTGYAKIHAGTTTTYPVSTNPNAYQEGDDAKPAGYVVGEEKSVTINGMNGPILLTGDSLTVADDGTLSVTSPAQYGVYNSSTTEDVRSVVAGKYIYIPYNSGSVGFFKVLSDVIVTGSTAPAGGSVFAFTAQPVTGYAAIPAGTTIEYLGKLGDKARVQVLSYVGTGTYGSDHPCSLTFDFVPKVAMMLYRSNGSNINNSAIYARFFPLTTLTTSYKDVFFAQLNTNGNNGRMKISEDRKTVSWFNTYGAYYQENESGITYVVAAIG